MKIDGDLLFALYQVESPGLAVGHDAADYIQQFISIDHCYPAILSVSLSMMGSSRRMRPDCFR